ncbi:MmcQ/YjbR family DNA-binding protein [Glycomyces xiaoerkulensis]|uniref:MmcQ/YjbR family DNA-binding protein n=1 Tax=Glycomyces xiaoerkulensis TaxID=2038139 RepID=UPI000C259EDA|nr:MmcQ/YjbR family DNA-binding protein [Glycomyces xiaoerkulensis]
MSTDPTSRLRMICRGLPEVTERPSHGTPAWFVRGKRMFAQLWHRGHHDEEFPQLWCAAPLGAQEESIALDPRRYFRPPYVGHRGWIGLRLDGEPDWDEIADRCEDAYRFVAPAKLVSQLDRDGG